MNPAIAIIDSNTLSCIGLSQIILRMMPGAESVCFSHYTDLLEDPRADEFFHYFVAAQEVLAGASYFIQRQSRTIVLVHGDEGRLLPTGFHKLNVSQSEQDLVRSIMQMAQQSHNRGGLGEPEAVVRAKLMPEFAAKQVPSLTRRECAVLRGIVSGLINKEIAAQLGISVSTVISHRNNLTAKLGTRSVSALTIYAVTHGIVRGDEI